MWRPTGIAIAALLASCGGGNPGFSSTPAPAPAAAPYVAPPYFFPPGTFDREPERDALISAKEPVLWGRGRDAYRMVRSPSFSRGEIIRVEREGTDAVVMTTGILVEEAVSLPTVKRLAGKWREVNDRLAAFATGPAERDQCGPPDASGMQSCTVVADGTSWLFEAAIDGGYHVLWRNTADMRAPDQAALLAAGVYLLELAGVKPDGAL